MHNVQKTYTVAKDPVEGVIYITTDGSGGYEPVPPEELSKICDEIVNHEPRNSFLDESVDYYKPTLEYAEFMVGVDYPNMKITEVHDSDGYKPLADTPRFVDQARAICFSLSVDKMVDEEDKNEQDNRGEGDVPDDGAGLAEPQEEAERV